MAKGKRKINYIVVHHSASPIDSTTPEKIRKWHVEDRGWSDIGYHYIIKNNNEVFVARPENKKGAHSPPRNGDSIGICVVGNYDAENPRKPMMDALETLINELLQKHNLTWNEVTWHRMWQATACPGEKLIPILHQIKNRYV